MLGGWVVPAPPACPACPQQPSGEEFRLGRGLRDKYLPTQASDLRTEATRGYRRCRGLSNSWAVPASVPPAAAYPDHTALHPTAGHVSKHSLLTLLTPSPIPHPLLQPGLSCVHHTIPPSTHTYGCIMQLYNPITPGLILSKRSRWALRKYDARGGIVAGMASKCPGIGIELNSFMLQPTTVVELYNAP